MQLYSIYHSDMPSFLCDLARCAAMTRLKRIGMNCGCEYTNFPLFRDLAPYSRFHHSLGTALIVWHFTGSREQAAAALFHDIASPVFSHSIDFMNGDHEKQESTEAPTERIILESTEIRRCLKRYGIDAEAVTDYHRYPIADNDSPRLSSDRLEYSLGNMVNYRIRSRERVEVLYRNLVVSIGEDGAPELAFRNPDLALDFSLAALECSRIYVAPADRFSMQMLAELMRTAIDAGVIRPADLWGDEPALIRKLQKDTVLFSQWERFRAFHHILDNAEVSDHSITRVIPAKKRYIDPLIEGIGRVSAYSSLYREQMEEFLCLDFSIPVTAE